MRIGELLGRLNAWPVWAKVALVCFGYVCAFLAAVLALVVYVSLTSGPDRDASSGMYAGGDALLFVFVWGAASLPPTALALAFLRRSRGFWWALSLLLLAIAATGVASVVVIAVPGLDLRVGFWSALAVLRIVVSPLLVGLLGLSAAFAPVPGARRFLVATAGIEGLVSVFGFVHWFLPLILSKGP